MPGWSSRRGRKDQYFKEEEEEEEEGEEDDDEAQSSDSDSDSDGEACLRKMDFSPGFIARARQRKRTRCDDEEHGSAATAALSSRSSPGAKAPTFDATPPGKTKKMALSAEKRKHWTARTVASPQESHSSNFVMMIDMTQDDDDDDDDNDNDDNDDEMGNFLNLT